MFLCSRPGTTLGSFHMASALSSACGSNVFGLNMSLEGGNSATNGVALMCRLLSTGNGMITAKRGTAGMTTKRAHAISFSRALPSMGA